MDMTEEWNDLLIVAVCIGDFSLVYGRLKQQYRKDHARKVAVVVIGGPPRQNHYGVTIHHRPLESTKVGSEWMPKTS